MRDSWLNAFAEIGEEATDPKYLEGANDEDVHTFVIRKLGEKVGALAGKIHTGRSRNEQVSLDTRLYLRASADTLLTLVGRSTGSLARFGGQVSGRRDSRLYASAARAGRALAALSAGIFRNVRARF